MTPIGLNEEKRGIVTVVHLQGRLDATNCEVAERFITARLDGGVQRLVLDMAELSYISSAGLWVVMMVRKRMAAAGGTLAISQLKPTLYEVFKISGFVPFLTITSDLDTAVTAVSR